MQIRRPLSMAVVGLLFAVVGLFATPAMASAGAQQTATPPKVVEDVQIAGNRRLRTEDLLYYVQTRPGDPFNPQQVERDYAALLALGFFSKTESRVLTNEGPRGGVVVTFEVKELPIIRDITFKGLHSVAESDVLKQFREQRVGVSKESVFDPVKITNASRVIRELLAERGHPNATVDVTRDEVSSTSTAITFNVNEGDRVRVVDIEFTGNKNFSNAKLRAQMKYVKEAGLVTRFRGQDILDRKKLDEDLRHVAFYMRSKGYLQARTGEPRIESVGPRTTGFFIPLPFLSSTDEGLRVTIPVTEGRVYRIGEIKVVGNSIYSEQVIRTVIGLKQGDIADGERIGKALYENLKKLYGQQGFIEYTAEPTPTFKDSPQNPNEGIVDFVVTIDEGKQFTLRRLEFIGNTFTRDNVLRREVLINEGDIYNQNAFEYSIVRLNQLGYFDPIDKEKDADFHTDEEEGQVDINVKVTEKGRQQISFNGGISGIGGSFFGLEYSTNNLFGRGESLSFNVAFGNRQRSFQFSFTEPYFRNRPITTGFSVFTYSQKFFGEGTLLSQNTTAQQGLLGSVTGNLTDFLSTGEENLFTQTSSGFTIFASAPLSEFYRKRRFTQFSRVGLSYQLSTSSVKSPAVNAQNNPSTFIPVIYDQPNILTSGVIGSFTFDTRNYTSKRSQDPTTGKEIAASVSMTGLGGDVRTYSPTLSYIQYIPIRHKTSENPEVFAFRLLGVTEGSFATTAKIRNANTLAFVNGIPIYSRFFLGGEDTIRGYNVRSISPIVPLDTFVTSRNVVFATNSTGTPVAIPGLPASLSQVGVFTGLTGSNSVRFSRNFTPIGADTQLLGNFEYRIPIFGPVSAAAYVDIGSAFNLRKGADQAANSNFLQDQPFLSQTLGSTVSLSTLAATANPGLALYAAPTSPFDFGLVVRDNRLVTQAELTNALRVGPVDPLSGLPFGFQQAFLRGEAQTNSVVRLNEGLFSKFTDYRASIGIEIRVQVPVVNVPFRLIYAYNPNARTGIVNGLPFIFDEQRNVFRFSVGRTF